MAKEFLVNPISVRETKGEFEMKEKLSSYMTEKQLELVSFALDFLKSNLDHDVVDTLSYKKLSAYEFVDVKEGHGDYCIEDSILDMEQVIEDSILDMEQVIEDTKSCFKVMVEIESKK